MDEVKEQVWMAECPRCHRATKAKEMRSVFTYAAGTNFHTDPVCDSCATEIELDLSLE